MLGHSHAIKHIHFKSASPALYYCVFTIIFKKNEKFDDHTLALRKQKDEKHMSFPLRKRGGSIFNLYFFL